jgi:hypothetical protein
MEQALRKRYNWNSAMVWQSYDKQNIIILDEPMAEQLSQYLENKESQLSAKIIEIILQIEGQPTLKESSAPSFFRLSEAVEDFGRKISRAALVTYPTLIKDKWKFAANEINNALWEYTEVLEGCVTELFQQIEQMGFEQWNVDVIRATTSIKDELTHRMDDLIWAIRRLEQQLKVYQKLCESQEEKWGEIWRTLLSPFLSLLDRSLEPAVRKCNKFLNFRYRKFIERYTGYLQLYETAQQSMNRFYHSNVLSSMDINQQDKFKELSFLLNLWENNCKARALHRTEPVRALRSCLSFEGAISLFTDYFFTIKDAIFDKSRLIKKLFKMESNDFEAKKPLVDNIAGYRKELNNLKELIQGYKKFHETTDPGTKSWLVRMFKFSSEREPKQFQELKKLVNDVKNLEAVSVNFQTSLEKESSTDREMAFHLQNEVERNLHEMGQPLASKELMRRNAKALVQSLQNLNEISSFDPKIVSFTCHTLCKAMCADWKYHVLQEMPTFHKLLEVHEGIATISDERAHMNRLHKFQRILNQLDMWIKNNDTLKHVQGIDLDINDIKAYLQDFLAYVQRLEPDHQIDGMDKEEFERPVGKAAEALLHYLYLFGNFFAKLHTENSEHRLMRRQLLFIDQYFEAIDRRIQDLKKH